MSLTPHKYTRQEIGHLEDIATEWFNNQTDPISVLVSGDGRVHCETHDAGRGENLYMAHEFIAYFYRKHELMFRLNFATPVLCVLEPCPDVTLDELARMQYKLEELAKNVFEQEQSIRLNRVSFDAFVSIQVKKELLYDFVYSILLDVIDDRIDLAIGVVKGRSHLYDSSIDELKHFIELRTWFMQWWARNDHLEKRFHSGKGCCR